MLIFLFFQEDRHLRGAFFDAIVGVAAYVGWQCCPILKPLLQQVNLSVFDFKFFKKIIIVLMLNFVFLY